MKHKDHIKSKTDQSQEMVTGEIKQPLLARIANKRFILIGGGIVFAAILCAGGVYTLLKHSDKKPAHVAQDSCANESENGILRQAAKALEPKELSKLPAIVTRIKAIPGYDKNPNCLYVVTEYYIVHNSDYNNAKSSLDKLEAVYDPKAGFSPALGPSAKIESLRKNVESLGKTRDLLKSRSPEFGRP